MRLAGAHPRWHGAATPAWLRPEEADRCRSLRT